MSFDTTMSAAILIANRRRIRRTIANAARLLRNDLRAFRAPNVASRLGRVAIVRMSAQIVGYEYRAPRADVRTLRRELRRDESYVNTPTRPIILDDGYACCGMEDARADRIHSVRQTLPILRSAIAILRDNH
jgi:hypothetical protein